MTGRFLKIRKLFGECCASTIVITFDYFLVLIISTEIDIESALTFKFSIMKFALATTVLVSTMVSTLSMNYDVNIFPKCKGVDFDGLSDNENEFVAETLENSYNQLHQLWDGGDKYLFGIESASASPELGEG